MATKGKEWMKTMANVFDHFTLRTLFKMASQGHFDDPEQLSPVKIGKESNVFLAQKEGEEVIIKIYRLEACDFNRMYDYIRFDPRYRTVKKSKRQVILTWVQKEYRNLLLAREAKVHVPTPYAYANNVLVMEAIGSKGSPAPQLKDAVPRNKQAFAKKIVEEMKKLHAAKLVHGDLSSFNILNDKESPILIDFSQSTTLENQFADEYLKRDIKNVAQFFHKHGLTLDQEKIYQDITNEGKNKN